VRCSQSQPPTPNPQPPDPHGYIIELWVIYLTIFLDRKKLMSSLLSAIPLDAIAYNPQGLVPAIAQDYLDATVLMMAWMNRESLEKTLTTGEAWYWSRSPSRIMAQGCHFWPYPKSASNSLRLR
jgi:hypothetical protein